MKRIVLITILFCSLSAIAQKEGQSFCEGDANESYFPLLKSKKYIIWGNTFYIEENTGNKTINGKTYFEYSQTWESGDVANLFLREDNGTILEYKEERKVEHIRLPKKIKKGESWTIDKGVINYEILSLKGELVTPICNYKNLLVLKSSFQNGEFIFFYQKGYGYIGATQDGELISFVAPKLPKEMMKKEKKED